jgi:prolyl-tRNA synthetase
MQRDLYDKALAMQKENIVSVDSWEEFTKALDDKKFVVAHWDGTTETEKMIKDETGATIRCIPFDAKEETGNCIKTGKPSAKRVLFAKAH